jgi:serine protease Do
MAVRFLDYSYGQRSSIELHKIGEEQIMQNNFRSFASKLLAPRRVVLLASVAAVGVATMIGSANLYGSRPITLMSLAIAAEPAVQPAGFADLVARVKPAVISVRVRMDNSAQTSSLNGDDNASPFQQKSPLDRFLRQFGFQDMPNGIPQTRNMAAEGSGFFISADGYAVTNNHVINNAKTVQVVTDDGRTLPAKVVGSDPRTDLAVIKVDGHSFPFVKFSDRDPRIGDWVIAVGNPFGLGGTVTAGVVSARGRDIGSGPYQDFIQIDAPINKGNSGGPAFDINGDVIGVNTAIFSPSRGSVGIGFDIPADTAKMVVAQLKDHGHVTRGWMGVRIQAVTPEIADSVGMKKPEGAIVDEPEAGSPAAKAGIVAGDVITAVDGKDVRNSRDLARRIASIAPGTSVTLAVLHNGENKTVSLTLGQLPEQRQASAGGRGTTENGTPRLGLTLAPASEVDGAGGRGVAVTGVEADGPAAEHGVKEGDVILDVAGKAVSSPADVSRQIADLRKEGKHAVLMRMKTSDGTRFVAIPLGNA